MRLLDKLLHCIYGRCDYSAVRPDKGCLVFRSRRIKASLLNCLSLDRSGESGCTPSR